MNCCSELLLFRALIYSYRTCNITPGGFFGGRLCCVRAQSGFGARFVAPPLLHDRKLAKYTGLCVAMLGKVSP